eukprot:TRINITY_DN62114_c0_g1_i2.p1 TRINITY_DN62114_c0_g1~~TRINITY_DN62114_c0_g1_i2.p1  ORF type:complete len:874 (-),score=109.84 TRINITY_DN62114_c0_g1_i2:337-2910(-)
MKALRIEYFVLYCADAVQTCSAFCEHFGLTEIEVKVAEDVGRVYRVAGSNATVVVFVSNSPDIDLLVLKRGTFIYDVAFRVDTVDEVTNETLNEWTIYYQEKTDIANVVTVGNNNSILKHSLVAPKNPNDTHMTIVLPGLVAEVARPEAKYALTHVDHFTFVIPAGTTSFWVKLYSELGFVRHIINSQDNPETGFQTIPDAGGAGLDTMVVTTEVNAFCIGFIAPYGIRHGHIGLYLRNNHGPGVQHLALHTDKIHDSIGRMKEAGVSFIPIKKSYYKDPSVIGPLQSVDEDVENFAKNELLFDTEGTNPETGKLNYLLQTFTLPHPVQRTLFFEVICRKGARGFGAGNINSLIEGAEADLKAKQHEILKEHFNTKCSLWNMRQLFEAVGETYADRTAFRSGDQEFSFIDNSKNILKMAKWLQDAGVKQLDRVALLAGSSLVSILSLLGLWFIGAVPVILNPEEDKDTVRNLAERAASKFVIVQTAEDALGKELVDLIPDLKLLSLPSLATLAEMGKPVFVDVVSEDETALILQTGSGGERAKLVPLTHKNIIANMEMARQSFWIATFDQPYSNRTDGSLCWLPLYRTLGLLEILNNMYCGATTTLFTSELTPSNWLSAIEKCNATYVYCLPQLLTQLHKDTKPEQWATLAKLRCVLFASTPVGQQVFDEFGKQGVKFLGIMGMAEAGGFMFMSHLGTDPNALRALPSMGMVIATMRGLPKGVGELCVMNNMACTKGYLNETEDINQALYPQEGQMRTKEMFKMQADGSFKWLCRKDELVDVTLNAAGEPIKPEEKSRTRSSPTSPGGRLASRTDNRSRVRSDAGDRSKLLQTSKHHYHNFASLSETQNTVPFVHLI